MQNRAARIITKSPFDTSSDLLLSILDWERLFLRRKKQKALMMFKTMNGLAPEYLQSPFSQRRSVYNLRDSEGKLTLPKPSTNYLKRSFSYSGAMLWNNTPKSLKTLYLLIILNNLLRRYLWLIYRIPTRQSCKTVILSFSFLTDDFPCLNKVFTLHYIITLRFEAATSLSTS